MYEEKEFLKSQLIEIKEKNSINEKVILFCFLCFFIVFFLPFVNSLIRFFAQIIQELKTKLNIEEEENCRLAGHGNKKQRIHYVDSLRSENSKLREVQK